MPRPLTKTTRDGRPYQRDPAIESAITALTKLTPAELIEHARSAPAGSAALVQSECLVYFIRDAWQRRDKVTMTALVGVLFTRCERILRNKIPDRVMPNAQDVRQNILGELGALIVQDDASLDFYECRFNLAFRALYVGHVRTEFDAINQLSSGQAEPNDGAPADDEVIEKLSRVLSSTQSSERDLVTAEDIVFRRQALRALQTLPDDEREAFILVHGLGYEAESDDPEKATAATRCGVTGRTIRKRLASAKAKLSRLKEE